MNGTMDVGPGPTSLHQHLYTNLTNAGVSSCCECSPQSMHTGFLSNQNLSYETETFFHCCILLPDVFTTLQHIQVIYVPMTSSLKTTSEGFSSIIKPISFPLYKALLLSCSSSYVRISTVYHSSAVLCFEVVMAVVVGFNTFGHLTHCIMS